MKAGGIYNMNLFGSPVSFELVSVIGMFVIVIGIILIAIIKQSHKNNRSPKLIVNAKVVAKRIKKTQHLSQGNAVPYVDTNVTYYVIFQVEGDDQVEFFVRKWDYSKLAEGDCGKLTFQGTKYLGFESNEQI